MASRLSLHKQLLAIMPAGKKNVYFQPPETLKINYPCIVYNRYNADLKHADDSTYLFTKAYEITVIDKDPDSTIVDAMFTAFPMIRFSRHYASDNLNHDTFIVYY